MKQSELNYGRAYHRDEAERRSIRSGTPYQQTASYKYLQRRYGITEAVSCPYSCKQVDPNGAWQNLRKADIHENSRCRQTGNGRQC
jgi:hypothetical protein